MSIGHGPLSHMFERYVADSMTEEGLPLAAFEDVLQTPQQDDTLFARRSRYSTCIHNMHVYTSSSNNEWYWKPLGH